MENKKKKGIKVFLVVALVAISFLMIIITSFNIVYFNSKVNGLSMYPTLNNNLVAGKDVVFINRFSKGGKGDIVVANIKKEENWDHTLEGQYIIKRMIGKSGDRIKIVKDGEEAYNVLVNGEIVYTKSYTGSVPTFVSFENYVNENILDTERITADGEIVVLKDEIFLMGDNWLTSYDSFTVGPLHKSSLVGRVDIIVKGGNNIVWGAVKGVFKMIF